MKFKTGLRHEIKANRKFNTNQMLLKKKHGIDADKDIVVVEKSNMLKFLLDFIGFHIRTLAKVCILILAFVGLVALVYPEPRNELWNIWKDTQKEITYLCGDIFESYAD